MKRFLLSVLASLALTFPAAGVTFNFVFDADQTPGIQSLVGTGSFTFANDPGIGTFAFNSLGAFSMSFSFVNGETFTQADILSDLSQVEVVLSPFGSGRRLQFSDTGAGSGGPFGGSLDFINDGGAGGALSFEPSYFGAGMRLYFSDTGPEGEQVFGDYLATNGVPDTGSTMMLMMTALAGIVTLRQASPQLARVRRKQ